VQRGVEFGGGHGAGVSGGMSRDCIDAAGRGLGDGRPRRWRPSAVSLVGSAFAWQVE
jgi:hypothetical protein